MHKITFILLMFMSYNKVSNLKILFIIVNHPNYILYTKNRLQIQ